MFKMCSLIDCLLSICRLVTFAFFIKIVSFLVLVIFIVILNSRHLYALDLVQLSLKHLTIDIIDDKD